MPAPVTIDELLDLSQKSGILDRKGLDEYLERLRAGPDAPTGPQGLADVLVRDGLLTRFQADQLLRGKWRNFLVGNKYKLLQRIGEGGMGTVWLCEHVRLRRRVALKVLPPAHTKDPSALERFHREGRAVAQLDHPNIVKVHDSDDDGKTHYLVMEYVEGSSLQDIIKRKGPMDVLRACHYVFQACLGLQHAHEAGIVHRDVKPGNLLLDRTGTVKLLDMGLARIFHDPGDNLTRDYDAHSILGTADYLSPEQALNSHGVDHRTDLYSLGMTFYYLLVGRAPFADGTLNQKLIWHQIRNPPPVTSLRPDVPPGLAAVLDRLTAKDPGERFQTAAEAAQALAPFVQAPVGPPPEDEMPELCPALGGPGSSGTLAPRTNRPSSPTATPALTAIQPSPLPAAGLAPSDLLPGRPAPDVLSKDARREIDWDNVLLWARLGSYALLVLFCLGGIAWWALFSSPTNKVIQEKVEPEPQAGAGAAGQDDKGPAWRPPPPPPPPRLNLATPGLIAALQRHSGPAERVAFSRDGQSIASCSHDGTVRTWAVETGTVVRTCSGHTQTVHDVACSPDGRFLASASYDHTARLWDARSGAEVRRFQGHTAPLRAIAFAPDGRHVLTGAGEVDKQKKPRDCTMRLWSADNGRFVRRFDGHTDAVFAVAFGPDGRRALSGSFDGTARVWDVAGGKELVRFTGHTGRVHAAAFSPDNVHAATGSADETIAVWAVADGKEKHRLRAHAGTVAAVAFSPDGRYLLSGADDKTMRLWEVATGREVSCYHGHTSGVWGLCFSPNGRLAVSASADHSLRLWGMPKFTAVVPVGTLRQIPGHTGTIRRVAVAADGRRAVSCGEDRTVRLWDTETGREVRKFGGMKNKALCVALSPDGQRVVAGGEDRTVRVWNAQTGKQDRSWEVPAPARVALFTPDGRRVFAAADSVAYLWDAGKGTELRQFAGHEAVIHGAALSPDNRTAVTASADQTVRVWDLGTGRELRAFRGHAAEVRAVALSPDGRLAVSGGSDRQLRVWEVSAARPVRAIPWDGGEVAALSFSPDGRRILAGGTGPAVVLFDAADGRPLHRISDHSGRRVHGVAFTPDGRRALTAGQGGPMVLSGLPPSPAGHVVGETGRFEGPHAKGIDRVAVSPDGRLAVSAGHDNAAVLWELETARPLQRFGHDSIVHFAAFAPDGRLVLTGSEDHSVRLWEARTGKQLRRLDFPGRVWSVAFTPDGERGLAGLGDGTARVFEVATGREERQLTGHTSEVNWVAVAPDGRLAATASWDRTVRVWELETGRELCCFRGHTAEARTVTFTPDGKHVLSAGSDRVLRLWEAETGKPVRELKGEGSEVWAVAVSPDGKRALSAGQSRLVRLWDLGSGRPTHVFGGHAGPVAGVVFTPDGRYALSGGHDRTMRLWGLPD